MRVLRTGDIAHSHEQSPNDAKPQKLLKPFETKVLTTRIL